MLTIQQINEIIGEGIALKFLAQSYSEVAANKLKRIRTGIESNRNFLNEIATLYSTVKLVATQQEFQKGKTGSPILESASKFILKGGAILPIKQHKVIKQPKIDFSQTAKTTINILVTSNYRFYGNLERDLIEFFVHNSLHFNADTIVIGRTGVEYLKAIRFMNFRPFIFKNDMPDIGELKQLTSDTANFERVLVYHSKFQSVLTQTPYIKDIKEAQFEVSIPRKKIDFIFEPEIDKMLAFFNSQISSMLLEQTFLESELARTAARLISMSSAEDNANDFLSDWELLLSRAFRSVYNIRLLDTITGSFIYRKGRKGRKTI